MKIGDVSKKYGISIETLRYYELEGLINHIEKDESGLRNYTNDDLKKIEFIICMRNAEMPIKTLKEFLKLYMDPNSKKVEKKNIVNSEIERINNKILKLQNAKKVLEGKISLIDEGKI